MLSLSCKAGVKAVIYLASQRASGMNLSIKDIAHYIDANEHTVGKLLQVLVKHEVIKSVKGPSGGFYIITEQLAQPLMNIVKAIDGEQMFKECALGLSKCSSLHPCPVHNQYMGVRDTWEKIFRSNSILDLCESVNSGEAHLIG